MTFTIFGFFPYCMMHVLNPVLFSMLYSTKHQAVHKAVIQKSDKVQVVLEKNGKMAFRNTQYNSEWQIILYVKLFYFFFIRIHIQ